MFFQMDVTVPDHLVESMAGVRSPGKSGNHLASVISDLVGGLEHGFYFSVY